MNGIRRHQPCTAFPEFEDKMRVPMQATFRQSRKRREKGRRGIEKMLEQGFQIALFALFRIARKQLGNPVYLTKKAFFQIYPLIRLKPPSPQPQSAEL